MNDEKDVAGVRPVMVCLSPRMIREMDETVKQGHLLSRSALVREAISRYLKDEKADAAA